MKRVGVLGAGSWGTALAILLANKGIKTVLWARNHKFAKQIRKSGENTLYLPGFELPAALEITSDISKAVTDKEVILFVVPSHGLREVAKQVSMALNDLSKSPNLPYALVSASKGIENRTLLTMTEIMKEVLPSRISGRLAALSGPSFAQEVASSIPTAITIAASEHKLCTGLQDLFTTETFRVYTSLDLMGVQLGGALKNVMAIASGISDGMGFGTNTRAALITRGLAEMSRLGMRLGANPLTFAGLAGLGDLVLTCTGDLSRNRQVGLKLGQGKSIDTILKEMSMVAEGVKTTNSVYAMAEKYKIEMPITNQVYRVLYQGLDPKDAVNELLTRPPRHELGDILA
ncbi:MAG: NAD(P)-dependent glycerol-3-phosphate dehydrogenase [Deltaproteobacteria bacterium]|nr:NAD(P)-dependent glycerol-3-phosphate dehydrogenase [Deltaproteobacteria bacterium]MBW1719096.1 NAD(P)-dependent glycerol-3-phosphate dehydrogenase [Deltaproteobacteria bacterium]MBW1932150.1 NAD(P)-dependent glycerol-3-phosphate dehydrogenase [Deltaproteobacteria bacterium]MBW1939183.1 NAD(P)-dependent glycerol-3-phosphate dehydrogenase [Deltaproteobacteria bacterium]MBW2079885.1 NAD(P)-dependent glycerol-3-phosphate dehydrogenase [Deltaproteobacteria bacterium]